MDPVTGVITVATAIVQSAERLLEFFNDVKEAPREAETIARDARSICAIALLIRSILPKADDIGTNCTDVASERSTRIVIDALCSCEIVLAQLRGKVEKWVESLSDGNVFRNGYTRVKWSIQAGNEIRKLQRRLETTKSTLDLALTLNVKAMYMHLRSFSGSYVDTGVNELQSKDSMNARLQSSSNTLELFSDHSDIDGTVANCLNRLPIPTFRTREVAYALPYSPRQPLLQEHAKSDDDNVLISQVQINSDNRASNVAATRGSPSDEATKQELVLSDLLPMKKYGTKSSRAICVAQERERQQGPFPHSCRHRDHYNTTKPLESLADLVRDDVFYRGRRVGNLHDECIGCSTRTTKNAYLDQFGAPEYYLERRRSFYPELYTTDYAFQGRIVVVAIMDSARHRLTRNYFLMYAESPRLWRKVILSIPLESLGCSRRVEIPDNLEYITKLLSPGLQKLLTVQFPTIKFVDPVTSLHMSLEKNHEGEFKICSPGVKVTYDSLETSKHDSKKILQKLANRGCPRYLESEVSRKCQVETSCYIVWNGSRMCLEHVAPFASAGLTDDNGFHDFITHLEVHCQKLHGCGGALEFIGVVTDDTGYHLKGYLLEYPSYTLRTLTASVISARSNVPMSVREYIAREAIRAVAAIHHRGVLLRYLGRGQVMLTSNLKVVFNIPKISVIHGAVQGHKNMPPELRKIPMNASSQLQVEDLVNFSTDIFQLGLVLWQILEQKAGAWGLICARSGCLSFPRHKCRVPGHHERNYVDLPPCGPDVPTYFNSIIQWCRSEDPKARPSALELLESLPLPHYSRNFAHDEQASNGSDDQDTTWRPGKPPPGMQEYLDKQSSETSLHISCNECGEFIFPHDDLYHCNVCHFGDFDLCLNCYDLGVRCWNDADDHKPPEERNHPMIRRYFKNGDLMNRT